MLDTEKLLQSPDLAQTSLSTFLNTLTSSKIVKDEKEVYFFTWQNNNFVMRGADTEKENSSHDKNEKVIKQILEKGNYYLALIYNKKDIYCPAYHELANDLRSPHSNVIVIVILVLSRLDGLLICVPWLPNLIDAKIQRLIKVQIGCVV